MCNSLLCGLRRVDYFIVLFDVTDSVANKEHCVDGFMWLVLTGPGVLTGLDWTLEIWALRSEIELGRVNK